ncbi:MAG: methyltransferase domain-containing protein [Desulfurivibrionaceae bacterium]
MKDVVDNSMDSVNCFQTDGPEERWDAVKHKYTQSAEAYSADNLKILSEVDASEKRANLIGYKEAVFPGANVVDMGCGPGLDSLIMARMVGPKGKVTGIDISDKMLLLAKSLAGTLSITNVEFRCGLMEDLPIDKCSADVVVCAGAINLSPQKDKVFATVYRILRNGGKLIIRDRLASTELPAEIRGNKDKWAACIAGAITLEEYLEKMNQAGFIDVTVVKTDKLSGKSPVYCGHITASK